MIRQKHNFISANWVAPVDSIRNVFRLIVSSFFLVRKVENETFSCTHKLGERTGQLWRGNSRCVRTHEKNSGEIVRRLDTIIQSIFCPIRSQHSLDRLEIVRWERVPRGSYTRAWNHRAFSPGPTDCPWVSEDANYLKRGEKSFQFRLIGNI